MSAKIVIFVELRSRFDCLFEVFIFKTCQTRQNDSDGMTAIINIQKI